MRKTSLSAVDKAALVLFSLGPETAAELLKSLPEQEAGRVSRALQQISDIPRDLQREVLFEFQNLLQASNTLLVDGQHFAKVVLERAFGPASELGQEILGGAKSQSLASLLQNIPAERLEQFVKQEHPQTAALILSEMHPELSSRMLQTFDEEQQTELLLRIAQLKSVRPEIIDELREIIRKELTSRSSEESIDGPRAAAAILNRLPKVSEQRLLSELRELDPSGCDQIEELMFRFEDLQILSERDLQILVASIPRDQLLLSLKLCSDGLRQKLMNSMSKRAAEQIQDDLSSSAKVKRSDVETAQRSIIELAKSLESQGKIKLQSQLDSDEYV